MGEVDTSFKTLELYILQVEEKLGAVISNKDVKRSKGNIDDVAISPLGPLKSNCSINEDYLADNNMENKSNMELTSTENKELLLPEADAAEIPVPSVDNTKHLISSTLLSKNPVRSNKTANIVKEGEITPLVISSKEDDRSNNVVATQDQETDTSDMCNNCRLSRNLTGVKVDENENISNLSENKTCNSCVVKSESTPDIVITELKDSSPSPQSSDKENIDTQTKCHTRSKSLQRNEEKDKTAHASLREKRCSREKLKRLSHLNIDVSRNYENQSESFYDDKSPEMQVVVNSLTPVLSRRRSSKKRDIRQLDNVMKECDNSIKNSNMLHSLTVNPEMSATWHGPVSGSNFHTLRPKMGIGMVISESTPLFANHEKSHMTKSASFHVNGTKTVPKNFSKTILDAMHKRYCRHQYSQKVDPGPKSTIVQIHKEEQFVATHSIRKPPQSLQLSTDGDTSSTSTNSSPKLNHLSTPVDVTPTDSPSSVKKLNIGNRERYQAEIEAVEACKWLRATGFPQYAQLYEDGQFPIDISVVEKDHDFLDRDSIRALFRRLNTLNKCALMKIYAQPKKGVEESDDDDLCALSDRWEFQKDCRRWSRKDLDPKLTRETVKSCSSHDSLLTDQDSSSQAGDSPVLDRKMPHDELNLHNMLDRQNSMPDSGTSTYIVSPSLKRAASERIKSAKNLLKKMESFKTRKGRKFSNNKNIVEISGPVVADRGSMQAKIQHLNCVDISPTSEELPIMEDSKKCEETVNNSILNSSFQNNNSADEAGSKAVSPNDSQLNHSSAFSEYHSAMSQLSQSFDSADLPGNRYTSRRNQDDPDLLEIFFLPDDHKPGRFPVSLQNGYIDSGDRCSINYRTGSFNLGKDASYRDYTGESDTISAKSHSSLRKQLSFDNSMIDNRYSVYDNMLHSLDTSSDDNVSEATLDMSTPNEELSRAQQELDLILHDLFENINGLNRAINGEDEVDERTLTRHNSEDAGKRKEADANLKNMISTPNNNNPLHIDTSLSCDDSMMHTDTSSSLVDPASCASPTSPVEANSVIDNSMDGDNDMTSNSSSSVDPSDQDIPNEEFSHDDSLDNANNRERRDSGVGSSLTRAPSDKKRKKIRWHSFQKSHRPSLTSRDLQINSLTVGQLQVLRKMSLLKLTAFMEKFIPSNRTGGWNWTVPRFMKRSKTPDYSMRNVFGIPLSLILQRTGQPLPQCILYAMRYLRNTAEDAVGIFRKSGVRSRIQKLRDDLEECPDTCDFDDLQAYDVADMFKQFFRELPECLLTVKLSETFISIFTYVQPNLRLEAMQAAIILLPDENREVLQALLLFLSDISQQSAVHQMNASNLAVCFGPSLFNIGGLKASSTPSPKPKHKKNLGVPDAKELMEQKAALECLTYMIMECKKLFMIPPWIFSRLHLSSEKSEVNPLKEYYHKRNGQPDVRSFGEDTIQQVLKEAHEKNRGWISFVSQNGVDIAYRKPHDSHPLREWKCTAEIEAPPVEVLNRLLHERHMWDEDMLSWAEVKQLSRNADVFQYISNSMAPQPTRHYCVLRYWRTDLAKGACAMVSSSINDPDVPDTKGVRAIEMASHFLIEPCGAGKSRMIHIARTDTRGRNPEWYNKAYGYIISNYMERIRDTFHQNIVGDGRETSL